MNYMRRAVTLASQALGSTSPNPAVGAVVVKNGEIVGRAIHSRRAATTPRLSH